MSRDSDDEDYDEVEGSDDHDPVDKKMNAPTELKGHRNGNSESSESSATSSTTPQPSPK